MKKKVMETLLVGLIALSLSACATLTESNSLGEDQKLTESSEQESVLLNVTTTFAGEDGNAQMFRNAVAAWCEETGNSVSDTSGTSDETFKTRVVTDFETGSEPDVLFFFNGADANRLIEAGKVISIEKIREEYPDYAKNMNDDLIADSLVDGKKYAVPVNGYWEAMFVNTSVLKKAGVKVPENGFTYDEFLEACAKIKQAGYTPIAAALGNIPHYWWEFAIFNNQSPSTHLTIPTPDDASSWVNGMNDIKELYEAGYFPVNTLYATDDETFTMFTEGRAAFLIDGSWKVGAIALACQEDPSDLSTLDQEKLDKFDVTFVPGKGERKSTDLIGGLSMGYYITAKAWNDPKKKDAAVSFVSYMTSDEVISAFAKHTVSALKNQPKADESQFNSLQIKSMKLISRATSLTGAVQDLFKGDCRVSTFDGMPAIVTGKVSAEDAVTEGLNAYYMGQ